MKRKKIINIITQKNSVNSLEPVTIYPTRTGSSIVAFEIRDMDNLEYLEDLYETALKEEGRDIING